ncbi:MAG: DUF928 domain-containing protein [Cyanobacteria bacterium J06628_6]
MRRAVFWGTWGLLTAISLGCVPPAQAEVFRPPPETINAVQNQYRYSLRSRCPACSGGGLGLVYLLLPETIAATAHPYPTLYWYTPTLGENKITVNLYHVVEDEAGDESLTPVYQTTYVISGEPGIASLSLSADTGMPPLRVGERYYWEVLFFCEPDSCSAELMAYGWLQRVDVDETLQHQLATLPLSEQVLVAAEAGLWFEATHALAALLRQQPDDPELQRRWIELLGSVGLESLAGEPFLPSG